MLAIASIFCLKPLCFLGVPFYFIPINSTSKIRVALAGIGP